MAGEPQDDCLFCRIVAGHVPATIVRETDTTVAFRDINPQAPTHVLVIPKAHYENAAALATGINIYGRGGNRRKDKDGRLGIALVGLGRYAGGQLAPALQLAAKYGDTLVIEEFIAGEELTVGVLGEEDGKWF